MSTAEVDSEPVVESLRAEIEILNKRIEWLEQWRRDQVVIQQAKELLIFAFQMDGQTCYNIMRKTASDNNLKLVHVAEWLLMRVKDGNTPLSLSQDKRRLIMRS